MAEAGPGPRWRFLVSPRWLAWHAFAVVAFWGMCWLGDWQLHRALSGNSLSWAYTFEWPLFALMGAYFWAKTIRDEFQLRSGAVTGAADGPPGVAAAGEALPGVAAAGEALPGVAAAGGHPLVRAAADGGRPAMAGQVPGGAAEPGDREAAARAAYLARLSQEVRGHGRWHGLR
ncbi:MAG: hypothetical protein ACLPKE_34645 [Streptosporangiaceae bacterium]